MGRREVTQVTNEPVAAHGGGRLQNLIVEPAAAERLRAESLHLPSVTLSQRHLCDLELLVNGAFSPLAGFMDRATYESVVEDMRLAEGTLWPIPITLDVDRELAAQLGAGARLALRDDEGFMLAVLNVTDVWQPDRALEADRVYGTRSPRHPGVRYLYEDVHDYYVGGHIEAVQLPTHYDYEELRHAPGDLRHLFNKLGWRRVVGFHTSRPMHRLHRELTLRAAKKAEAHILLHPVVGITRPQDLAYFARVKCYQAIQRHYPHALTVLSLLPLAMRMAGPRSALWHALIRQNYGCTHFIVGSDHGSPLLDGTPPERLYPRYAAQELLTRHREEIAIEMVAFERLEYALRRQRFIPEGEIAEAHEPTAGFSDVELARHLAHSEPIPSWFSFPDVVAMLRKVYPPRNREGLVLFFTGLSGSGKSTLARIMYAKFIEAGHRPVTLLDGDVVRRNLSSELGFSKAHRDLNVRRIGFVASEICKNGGVAICAPIAPYAGTRRAVRELVEQHGAMIEIHVATPLAVCEARDRKGLYAKARKGLIPEFTGISDPYEPPEQPELRIDTSDLTPMQAAQEIYLFLLREGYLDTLEDEEPANS